ncbi:MAG: 5-(carboxyamino)imidazole ribonucleotide synthase [Acidobacteriota bacterium]
MSNPRIGILGAGQLALMLAQAARPLGAEVLCAGHPGDPAEQAAPVLQVDLENTAQVAGFASRVDLLTFESENIAPHVLDHIHHFPLFPNARAIATAQDRLHEKRFFESCDIEVAPYCAVDSLRDLYEALDSLGTPAILKTRRLGYDGKGQFRITQRSQAPEALATLSPDPHLPTPCILEGFVNFEAEVSLLAARSRSGQIAFYPLIQNHHRDGILRTSIAPYSNLALQAQAELYLRSLLEQLEYIGVLAVEFFVAGDKIIANEMAPRVHNSGHWTIEGSATSQFTNHLRAILDLPLGPTASRPTVLLNCIGSMPPKSETDKFPTLFRHDYGKSPRPNRKVGHLTCFAEETATIQEWQRRLNDQ